MKLYIDPGTGALLFALVVSVVSTVNWLFNTLKVKLKFWLTGGKSAKTDDVKLNIVVFSDGKQYYNVFKPVLDELDKRKMRAEYWTMSEDDPILNENYNKIKCVYIGSGNKAFAKLNVMNAKICLSTTPGLDVFQWKRSKNTDKYVHISHAIDDYLGYRMFGLDYYDSVLLNGSGQEEGIRKLEEMRNIKKKDLKIVGSTYMDELQKKKLRLNNEKEKEKHNKTILLAPSWGDSSLLNRFGSLMIKDLIDTGYDIIIRPHPQSFKSEKELINKLMTEFPDSEHLKWDKNVDNFDSLNEADIMISDFSSVMMDFAFIFRKPFIYSIDSFDMSIYDAEWIGKDRQMFRILKTIGVELKSSDIDNIGKLISKVENNWDVSKIDSVIDECWDERGKAASNVVDYLKELRKEDKKDVGTL